MILNEDKDVYDYLADSIFDFLRKTNRLFIGHDKGDEFLHAFIDKYKVCNITLVGSVFDDIPWRAGYSITNLGDSLKIAAEDGSLNAPVDVLYLDVTTKLKCDDYLNNLVDDNTVVVLKIKHPDDTNIPPELTFLKDKTPMEFGSWGETHNNESDYFIIFI